MKNILFFLFSFIAITASSQNVTTADTIIAKKGFKIGTKKVDGISSDTALSRLDSTKLITEYAVKKIVLNNKSTSSRTIDTTKLYRQGGNSFGENAVLGTNDKFNLFLAAEGDPKVLIGTDGSVSSVLGHIYGWYIDSVDACGFAGGSGIDSKGNFRVSNNDGYIYFSEEGYLPKNQRFGFRDSLGKIQYKDSLGTWKGFSGANNDTAFAKLNYNNVFSAINEFNGTSYFANQTVNLLGDNGGATFFRYDDSLQSTAVKLVFPYINGFQQDSVAYRKWVRDYVSTNSGGGTVTNVTGTSPITVTNNTTTPVVSIADGAIGNIKLSNSTISGVSLGSNLNNLSAGNGIVGSNYNGSTSQSWRVDSAVFATKLSIQKKVDSLLNIINTKGTVTSVGLTTPTGLTTTGTPITTSGILGITYATGYSIPTNAAQSLWDGAYTNRITTANAPLFITSNTIRVDTTTRTTGLATLDALLKDSTILANAIAAKGTGTVTSVGTGYGLTGGTITTTGTVRVDSSTILPLSSITLNSSAVIHNTPITFTRLGGAWSGTMSLANQTANTIFRRSTGTGTPSFGSIDSAYFGGLFAPQVRAAQNNFYTLPSLTSGSVLFSNGSTIAQDNTNLFWDNTSNKRLGIGTNSPLARLQIQGYGSGSTNEVVRLSNEAYHTLINMYCASSTGSYRNILSGNKNNGTLASPTILVNGDQILSFASNGYDGGAYLTKASLDFLVDGAVSTGVVPMAMSISTSSSTAGRTERIRVASTGGVLINQTTDNGLDKLQVAGNINLTTAGNKIKIASSTNTATATTFAAGTTTLVSGTITVSTTAITASSNVILTLQNCVNCGTIYLNGRTAGTSFTITSTNVLDGSLVYWEIRN